MRDRIERKIEEIRQKPEHVRIWYAWAGVFIAMFFVFLIWIFTLEENLSRTTPADDVKKIRDRIPVGQSSGEVKSLDEVFGNQGMSGTGKTEVR